MIKHLILLSLVTSFGSATTGSVSQLPQRSNEQTGVIQPPEEKPLECVYRCMGGVWVLDPIVLPPGFSCPSYPGGCQEGEVFSGAPQQNGTLTRTTSEVAENTGLYQYDPSSGQLLCAWGKADKGFALRAKLTMEEFVESYPEQAAKVLSDKAGSLLEPFEVELPALVRK